jgi:hypothetical protein
VPLKDQFVSRVNINVNHCALLLMPLLITNLEENVNFVKNVAYVASHSLITAYYISR